MLSFLMIIEIKKKKNNVETEFSGSLESESLANLV